MFGLTIPPDNVDPVDFLVVARTDGCLLAEGVQPGHLGHLAVGIVSELRRRIVVAGAHVLVLVGPGTRVLNGFVGTFTLF